MNRMFHWPAALLGLAVASAGALAQPSGGPMAGGPSALNRAAEPPSAAMQEDVEIMRRLLDGAFAQAYGVNGIPKGPPPIIFSTMSGNDAYWQYPANPAGKMTGTEAPHPAPQTEGVYLKDYGVVYTTTLPLPPFSVLPSAGGSPGSQTPPDEWDRIRKELHGETPTPEGKPVPGHTPLSEAILKVLADNGKHFGSVADGERISVAVTFRGAANCANCHQNPWNKEQPGSPVFRNQGQGWPTYLTQPYSPYGMPAPTGGAPGAGPPTEPQTAPAWLTDARNAILLGDLHLKQGKTDEAITAYKKAADQIGQVIARQQQTEVGLTREDVPALLTAVDLCNKMATACVQAGQPDAASAMLKQAGEMAKRAEKLTGGAVTANPAPATPGAQALPAKLVVTATKKQLDDVAAGRMTFETFCKAATVEFVNLPVEKK